MDSKQLKEIMQHSNNVHTFSVKYTGTIDGLPENIRKDYTVERSLNVAKPEAIPEAIKRITEDGIVHMVAAICIEAYTLSAGKGRKKTNVATPVMLYAVDSDPIRAAAAIVDYIYENSIWSDLKYLAEINHIESNPQQLAKYGNCCVLYWNEEAN